MRHVSTSSTGICSTLLAIFFQAWLPRAYTGSFGGTSILRAARAVSPATVRIRESRLPLDSRTVAGDTALAALSMLVPPKEPVYALGSQAWKKIANNVEQIPVEDVETCRIQLWCYDPALFARGGRVDCFSLYLSLRDEEDERVEAALEEMMEKTAWS